MRNITNQNEWRVCQPENKESKAHEVSIGRPSWAIDDFVHSPGSLNSPNENHSISSFRKQMNKENVLKISIEDDGGFPLTKNTSTSLGSLALSGNLDSFSLRLNQTRSFSESSENMSTKPKTKQINPFIFQKAERLRSPKWDSPLKNSNGRFSYSRPSTTLSKENCPFYFPKDLKLKTNKLDPISTDASSGAINFSTKEFKKCLSQASSRVDKGLLDRVRLSFSSRNFCQCKEALPNAKTCPGMLEVFRRSFPKNKDEKLRAIYHRNLQKEPTKASSCQIDRDLDRTFSFCGYFQIKKTKIELKRVLGSLSIYYNSTGYVQGMSLIVGAILLHMEEWQAFWMTVFIFEELHLNGVFKPGMPEFHQKVDDFQRILQKRDQKLSKHFKNTQTNLQTVLSSSVTTMLFSQVPFSQHVII